MSAIPISYYLVLSAILFGLGVVAVVFKRNIITIFMSIELMLNAVNLAFVAFASARSNPLDGMVFVFFVIVVAAGRSCRGPRHRDFAGAESRVAQHRTRESAQALMPILDHLWIILALPLAGAAINGLFGKRWAQSARSSMPSPWVPARWAVSCLVRSETGFASSSHHSGQARMPYVNNYFTWMIAGPFRVNFELQVDQLTVVMLCVVAFVGMLIHIYSTGYMAHEGGYYRFFSYLNLFMFFMLTLVLGANLIVMFVGWEGVGLCSYLLIGFYYLKKSAADAGKKAFIVTRIGDFGFTVGVLLAFCTYQLRELSPTSSRSFSACSAEGAQLQIGVLTTIALLLFTGAIGKSAQLPLYVWLPDAMEGPTPVSALIHAATMVTAGVYMVARMNPLFSRAPLAMLVVAIVGAITALYSATIGLVQTDIKKVLAYSTVSQLGYMFLACGVGSYAAGIFHLMTHAFFKGLLFLAAGSVIHAMGGEQDMMKMGGLRKQIPITYWTMFIGTLAIAGIPGFAGFFSKDEILEAAALGPVRESIAVAGGHRRRGPHVVLHVPAGLPDFLWRAAL